MIENIVEVLDGVTIEEDWLPINGYNGLYEISSFGRIKSFHFDEPKIIKLQTSIYGYWIISLNKGKKKTKNHLVHILVAKHFIPNPENKPEVNHKKGIKKDNRFFELEWSTKLENVQHAFNTGLVCHKGIKNANSNLTEDEVLGIFNSDGSYIEIASRYNVSKNNVCQIKTGSRWGHLTKKQYNKKPKITIEQVQDILRLNLSAKEASERYNVPKYIISQLKNRKDFKHLF